MVETFFAVEGIPAVLYGDDSDKVYIFVHGKSGKKEEAKDFAEVVCGKGYQVLAIDLPGHGARKEESDKFVPWEVVPELQSVMHYMEKHWKTIALRANSIGAYFSMLSLKDQQLEKVLFASPILDMTMLIRKMMGWSCVTEAELKEKGRIETDFGETLDAQYYQYAKENQIKKWLHPTAILYAGKDNLTDRITVDDFVKKHGCTLSVMEGEEHWFHTPEQMAVLNEWTAENS